MAPRPGLTWLWNQIRRGIVRNLADLGSGVRDPAGFVADDNIAPGPARDTQAVMRYLCRQWARGNLPTTDLADAVNGSACRQYLENIGEYPDEEGSYQLPFQGGQCETNYSYTIRVTGQAAGAGGGYVPIDQNFSFQTGGLPVSPPTVEYLTDPPPGINSMNVRGVRDGDPNGYLAAYSWCAAPGDCQGQISVEVISITRLDGQPDNCGDPEAEYERPAFKPGLPPVDLPTFDTPIGPYQPDIRIEPDGPKIYPPDGGEPFEILPAPEGESEDCSLKTMEVLVAVLVVQVQPPTRDDGAYLTGDYYLFSRAGNLQWVNTESGARSTVHEIKVSRQILTNPDPYVYDDYIISPALGAELSATGILGRVPDYATNGE